MIFLQGHTDVNLEHFSIAHDRAYILPLLQQAVKLNPQLKFIASPWSPPEWMKIMKYRSSGVAFWNLALDEAGGPKLGTDCNNCTGLITVTKDEGYKLTKDYEELANFSKNIKPGTQRIKSVPKGNLESLAFQNPDGSYVLIVSHKSTLPIVFSVDLQDQSRWYIAQKRGISTFHWR